MDAVYSPVLVRTPHETILPIRLILGSFDPLRSTYVGTEATMYGTLMDGTKRLANVKICAFEADRKQPTKCTNTNDVGQYELVMPARQYTIELPQALGKPYALRVDLSNPGYYHNRLSFPPP